MAMNCFIPNTFQIKTKCACLIEFESIEALLDKMPIVSDYQKKEKLLIVGAGSNLLPTKDYEGLVLHSKIMGYDVVGYNDNQVFVKCGSGENVDDFIAWSIDQGYYGMENLSLIPGEVGASAVQNIGAYGVEVKDVIDSIEAIEISTGKKVTIYNDECDYAYRYSKFKTDWRNRFIITYVTYRLCTDFIPHTEYGNISRYLDAKGMTTPTAKELRSIVISIRNSKLPDYKVEGNAGSFFMNPIVDMDKFMELLSTYPNMPHYNVDSCHEKIPAGWLIDQCGWKGRSLGRAGVHKDQALVLVNRGGATGNEVVELCNAIQNDVFQKFGIKIYPEVNII